MVTSKMLIINGFEATWGKLLNKYYLVEHHFLVNAYDERKNWAKHYDTGKS
jgi:hypothetical protein